MVMHVSQTGNLGDQVAVPPPCALLTAVWREFVCVHAHRRASLTTVTIWPISKDAAAAKTVLHQAGIDISIDQVRGRRHLRTGLPVFQITARVRRSCVELQGGKR